MIMAKLKEEAIIVFEDNESRELKGAELEAFLIDRKQIQDEMKNEKEAIIAKQQARLDILTKLGLTPEEIAVLGL
jgi:transcription initiation factor IIE alpha subunit